MRKLVMPAAVAAMLLGSLGSGGVANAGQATLPTPDPDVQMLPKAPSTDLLDCYGTTGAMGCGPGWFWRDGWRGWACYPC